MVSMESAAMGLAEACSSHQNQNSNLVDQEGIAVAAAASSAALAATASARLGGMLAFEQSILEKARARLGLTAPSPDLVGSGSDAPSTDHMRDGDGARRTGPSRRSKSIANASFSLAAAPGAALGAETFDGLSDREDDFYDCLGNAGILRDDVDSDETGTACTEDGSKVLEAAAAAAVEAAANKPRSVRVKKTPPHPRWIPLTRRIRIFNKKRGTSFIGRQSPCLLELSDYLKERPAFALDHSEPLLLAEINTDGMLPVHEKRCRRCDEPGTSDQGLIPCSTCRFAFHRCCLSFEEFAELEIRANRRELWLCHDCQAQSSEGFDMRLKLVPLPETPGLNRYAPIPVNQSNALKQVLRIASNEVQASVEAKSKRSHSLATRATIHDTSCVELNEQLAEYKSGSAADVNGPSKPPKRRRRSINSALIGTTEKEISKSTQSSKPKITLAKPTVPSKDHVESSPISDPLKEVKYQHLQSQENQKQNPSGVTQSVQQQDFQSQHAINALEAGVVAARDQFSDIFSMLLKLREQGYITRHEQGLLKNLAIVGGRYLPVFLSIVDLYRRCSDIDDVVDTLRRVILA